MIFKNSFENKVTDKLFTYKLYMYMKKKLEINPVLDMILNHLRASLQPWRFRRCPRL